MSGRWHLGGLAALALTASMLGSGPAQAATCDNSWNAPSDGRFDDPSHWSAGHVPTQAENACITVDGTYTVQLSSTVHVGSLTLGAESGLQVLVLVALPDGTTAELDQESALTVGANASLELDGPATVAGGTVTNAGDVVLGDTGFAPGDEVINSDVLNTGSFDVRSPRAYVSDPFHLAHFTNEGTVGISDGARLAANGTFDEAAGGTVETSGTGVLDIAGTYLQGDGTTVGNPVRVGGAVSYYGTGGSSVIATGVLSGNIAPNQRLAVRDNGTLKVSASFSNAGTIVLDDAGPQADAFSGLAATAPGGTTLTNIGVLRSVAGTNFHFLHLDVVNLGTVAVDGSSLTLEDKPFSGRPAFPTTFTNQGIVTVSADGQLQTGAQTFVNAAGGLIGTSGAGRLLVGGGTYQQDAGVNVGNPVLVTGGTIHYTGSGASSIEARGTDALTLAQKTLAAGQTLAVAADCTAGNGVLQLSGATTVDNLGTLQLLPSACGTAALQSGGATLTNDGVLQVGGGFNAGWFDGTLRNRKTLSLGGLLQLGGGYTETARSTLTTALSSPSSYGQLHAGGQAALAGSLAVDTSAFTPSAGQTYTVVVAGQLTGTWKAPKTAATNGPQFQRFYAPSSAGFVVRQATLSAAPTSGPAGTAVEVSGGGFASGEQVTVTFKDKRRHLTTLVTVNADGSGSIDTTVAIPAGASRGAGTLSATGQTSGLAANAAFTVV
jgi:hypothetical protein